MYTARPASARAFALATHFAEAFSLTNTSTGELGAVVNIPSTRGGTFNLSFRLAALNALDGTTTEIVSLDRGPANSAPVPTGPDEFAVVINGKEVFRGSYSNLAAAAQDGHTKDGVTVRFAGYTAGPGPIDPNTGSDNLGFIGGKGGTQTDSLYDISINFANGKPNQTGPLSIEFLSIGGVFGWPPRSSEAT